METSAPSLAAFCPRHKGPDHIRQVSVVYAESAPAVLSPLPVLKSADRIAWAGTITAVAGAAAIWIGTAVQHRVSAVPLAIAFVLFGYAIACYGWAAARRASIVRVRRGMARALAVWEAGLYCERCDGVFFPAGALVPPGATRGALMSAGDFQHLVWTAGGYDAPKVG